MASVASFFVSRVDSEVDKRLDAIGTDEAAARLVSFGPNSLPRPTPPSVAAVFARQFKSPLIYILFVAAVLAVALGHRADALVIAFVSSMTPCREAEAVFRLSRRVAKLPRHCSVMGGGISPRAIRATARRVEAASSPGGRTSA